LISPSRKIFMYNLKIKSIDELSQDVKRGQSHLPL